VRALSGGQHILAIDGSEDVVIPDIAVLGAGEAVGEAERASEGVCCDWVGNGADGFDGVVLGMNYGAEDSGTPESGW
jgi:hypothetical protein